MAFVSPRASGLWHDDVRMSCYNDDATPDDLDLERNHDGRTPLDKTIDRIGMGESSSLQFLRPRRNITRTSSLRQLPVDTALAMWLW